MNFARRRFEFFGNGGTYAAATSAFPSTLSEMEIHVGMAGGSGGGVDVNWHSATEEAQAGREE